LSTLRLEAVLSVSVFLSFSVPMFAPNAVFSSSSMDSSPPFAMAVEETQSLLYSVDYGNYAFDFWSRGRHLVRLPLDQIHRPCAEPSSFSCAGISDGDSGEVKSLQF